VFSSCVARWAEARLVARGVIALAGADSNVWKFRHAYTDSPESAIRELIRSGDPWLVACAVAAAGELGMRRLAPDIQEAAKNTGEEVAEVARSVAAQLAA